MGGKKAPAPEPAPAPPKPTITAADANAAPGESPSGRAATRISEEADNQHLLSGVDAEESRKRAQSGGMLLATS